MTITVDQGLHGVRKIEAKPVVNDWLGLRVLSKTDGDEYFDGHFEITFFMPQALAEAYAAAINAVNDQGREVEGEPIETPEPEPSHFYEASTEDPTLKRIDVEPTNSSSMEPM